ncbi:glutathione S-transferase N-terminal domain-containing protein [Thioclava nitratireducens]|uniref:glutathione S-transferase N-terminal domain-containing protein n=1 Tax=Thioclava nitratireducens TaxID=1915078 RepID=UPI002480FEFB|nr:glutathione S-transferase N-terminal domain-containing protein [Thioclava nitratireducens]WGT49553.1 glutathione S-transferase domain-containing protein [Thioclava nitratireducens]
MSAKHIVYHIPVCPFSQRLEILLALRGRQDVIEFRVIDITKPRDPALLAQTRGTTALPVLETPDGRIIKESLIVLRYLDEVIGGPPLRRKDPVKHATESMLITRRTFHDGGLPFCHEPRPRPPGRLRRQAPVNLSRHQ